MGSSVTQEKKYLSCEFYGPKHNVGMYLLNRTKAYKSEYLTPRQAQKHCSLQKLGQYFTGCFSGMEGEWWRHSPFFVSKCCKYTENMTKISLEKKKNKPFNLQLGCLP